MRTGLPATLAVVGMLPGSLLPVVVSAARNGLGFTIAQSATLGGAAIFWAAIGALAMALIGVPRNWKRAAALGLAILALLDLASMPVTDFVPLLAVRAVHGLVGGMLTGIGYATIGNSRAPDRLFGVLLAMQFLVGGAAIALLPSLIAAAGPWLLFAALAGGAMLVLALVPLMPAIDLPERHGGGFLARVPRGASLWVLLALLLIQAGHTAGGAFILELGRSHGMSLILVQSMVGLAGMAGVVGAIGAAAIGARYGRLRPVLWATGAGAISAGLLLLPAPSAFAAGVLLGSIVWAWSIPFVLAACAALDGENVGAVWSSFVAKLGLGSGPLLGALVVTGERFEPAIILSAVLALAGTIILVRLDRVAGLGMR